MTRLRTRRLAGLVDRRGTRALIRRFSAEISVMRAARALRPVRGRDRSFGEDDIAVLGFFRTRSGLGRAAELFVRDLRARAKNVTAVDISEPLGFPLTREDMPSVSVRQIADMDVRNVIVVANPPHTLAALARLSERVRDRSCLVAHWAWEVDRVPDYWLRCLNYVDEVWTPSDFVRRALERVSGELGNRCRVVPYPFAAGPIPVTRPEERRAAKEALGLPPDDVVVLSSWAMSSGFARKNPLAAIDIFRSAFPRGSEAVTLLLRCLDPEEYAAGDRLVRDACRLEPRIRYVTTAGRDGIRSFYAAADLYLSPHRGEGFGLNLAEALTADIPVLATSWSLSEHLTSHPAFTPIESTTSPVDDPQGFYDLARGACWAEPDIRDAAQKLRALAARIAH